MSKQNQISDSTALYKAAFSHWPKAAGEQPTALLLDTIHAMNIRPGKHALACAMYLRDGGATDQQVRLAAAKLDTKGGLQGSLFNYMRQLCNDGLMRRDMTQPRGVYKITLTKKGEAQVARYTKATAPVEAKPAGDANVKRKRIARKLAKAKAKHVVTPAPEPVTEPVNAEPVPVNAEPVQGDAPAAE